MCVCVCVCVCVPRNDRARPHPTEAGAALATLCRRRHGKTYMYKLTASAVIRAEFDLDSEKASGQKRRTARTRKARRADEKGKKGRRWMDAGVDQQTFNRFSFLSILFTAEPFQQIAQGNHAHDSMPPVSRIWYSTSRLCGSTTWPTSSPAVGGLIVPALVFECTTFQ